MQLHQCQQGGEFAGRVEAQGEASDQVRLRVGQFLIAHRFGPDALHLFDDAGNRLIGRCIARLQLNGEGTRHDVGLKSAVHIVG